MECRQGNQQARKGCEDRRNLPSGSRHIPMITPSRMIRRSAGKSAHLRDDDARKTAKVGVGGHQVRLANSRGGIHDSVGGTQAMLHGKVPGGEGNRLIEGHHPPVECLGNEPVGHRPAPLLGKVLVDLAQHDRRKKHGAVPFQVMGEGRRLGILGKIFEPSG